ncbi:MAG TPA: response regulator [Candidatus Saccharimonadales bacterium]|nr:response regulator [Candidatus Saccharimonadales bacterium]
MTTKILLVEDEKILLEMYKDKFTNEGFEVQTASEGQDGIAKMKSFRPDIVLLDLIMPGVTGFDVLKIAKADPELSKIPILVLTNIYADAEDLVKNWGVEFFLLKSDYTPYTIAAKVKQIISEKSPAEKMRQ